MMHSIRLLEFDDRVHEFFLMSSCDGVLYHSIDDFCNDRVMKLVGTIPNDGTLGVGFPWRGQGHNPEKLGKDGLEIWKKRQS
ncbi:hypothetical protein Tco_1176859 [Tanacetum coccineum]